LTIRHPSLFAAFSKYFSSASATQAGSARSRRLGFDASFPESV
jgi:hypothetical protein